MRAALPLILFAPWISLADLRSHRIPNPALVALLAFIEFDALLMRLEIPAGHYLLALSIFLAGCLLNLSLRGAIGMGDVKLFALSSLLLGTLARSLTALLLAALFGLIYAGISRERVIPFGPAILSGAVLVLMSR